MAALRSLICIVMIALILPWGGYVRAATLSASGGGGAIVQATPADSAAVRTAMQKKCRTLHLPGAPCGPDHAMIGGAVLFRGATLSGTVAILEDWHGTGRHCAPAPEPPRIF